MIKKKLQLGLLFGGKSAEHEVSLRSAQNVLDALDRQQFEPILIGIDKTGHWHLTQEPTPIQGEPVTLIPASNHLISTQTGQVLAQLDVVFPILHGPLGEDGTVQGLLRLAGIPFVGADVLGSSIGMDKDSMRRLLKEAGLPIADFLVYNAHQQNQIAFARIKERLGLPFFVKPANMGSSVGISKVNDETSFQAALNTAFRFDSKIVLEAAIPGQEIEVSVLGNEKPVASLPGKIIPQDTFYSYQAKYLDEQGALLEIPASLSPSIIQEAQQLALTAFHALACHGMARVDFFLTPDDKLIINEINTIPGFTNISMYPKLWEASGLTYSALITRLIELALQREAEREKLQTSYQ